MLLNSSRNPSTTLRSTSTSGTCAYRRCAAFGVAKSQYMSDLFDAEHNTNTVHCLLCIA